MKLIVAVACIQINTISCMYGFLSSLMHLQMIMGVLCLSFCAKVLILQCMCYSSLASKCQFNSMMQQSDVNEINIIGMTGNFIEIPSPVTIEVENGMEMDTVFRCRHQRIEAVISWLINGSSSRLYRDVVDAFIRDSNDTRIDTLTIPAILEYNGTNVVCVATFFDESPDEVTPPAILVIIGMLVYRVLLLDYSLLCFLS